jgi:hypothetical protein
MFCRVQRAENTQQVLKSFVDGGTQFIIQVINNLKPLSTDVSAIRQGEKITV